MKLRTDIHAGSREQKACHAEVLDLKPRVDELQRLVDQRIALRYNDTNRWGYLYDYDEDDWYYTP